MQCAASFEIIFIQKGKQLQCMNNKIVFPIKFGALKPMFSLKTEKRDFKNCAYY